MQTIIVPTDFSENAENAIEYACGIATVTNSRIVLLHTFGLPVIIGDVPVMPVTEHELRSEVRLLLNKAKDKFNKAYPRIEFIVEAIVGVIDKEINKMISKHNAQFVIMGTKGMSGVGEILIGTNTAAVIENARCPVISVPGKAKYNGLNHLVFAAHYGNHSYSHAEKVIELAKYFNSKVTLLHVTNDDADNSIEDSELLSFKNRLIDHTKYANISYMLLNDKDAFHGINTFIDNYQTDLLIISMRSRSLWQKIFSRSLTKRMSYHSHIPLMALHITDK